ncbi:MAG: DUF167 family protein [Rhodospirillales bacterium]
MAEPCFPFIAETNGVRVAVRLTPKAASERIDGVVADAQGNGVLRVAVTAAAEKDRANRALIKLLAKEWRLAKSSIALVGGAKDRNKTLRVEGPAGPLYERLTNWATGQFPWPQGKKDGTKR